LTFHDVGKELKLAHPLNGLVEELALDILRLGLLAADISPLDTPIIQQTLLDLVCNPFGGLHLVVKNQIVALNPKHPQYSFFIFAKV